MSDSDLGAYSADEFEDDHVVNGAAASPAGAIRAGSPLEVVGRAVPPSYWTAEQANAEEGEEVSQLAVVGRAVPASYWAAEKASGSKERQAAVSAIDYVDLLGGMDDGSEKEGEEDEGRHEQQAGKAAAGRNSHAHEHDANGGPGRSAGRSAGSSAGRSAPASTLQEFRKSSARSSAQAALGSLLSSDKVLAPLRSALVRAYERDPARFSPSLGGLIKELIEEGAGSDSGASPQAGHRGDAYFEAVDSLESEMAQIFRTCRLAAAGNGNGHVNGHGDAGASEGFEKTMERLVENGGNGHHRDSRAAAAAAAAARAAGGRRHPAAAANKPSPRRIGARPASARSRRAAPALAVNGSAKAAPRRSDAASSRSPPSASLQWRTLNDFYKDHQEIFSPNGGGEYSFAVAGLNLPGAPSPSPSPSSGRPLAPRGAKAPMSPPRAPSPAPAAPAARTRSRAGARKKAKKKPKKKAASARQASNLSRLLRPTASSLAAEYRNNYKN